MYVDKGREEITCCRTSGNTPHVNGGRGMNMQLMNIINLYVNYAL